VSSVPTTLIVFFTIRLHVLGILNWCDVGLVKSSPPMCFLTGHLILVSRISDHSYCYVSTHGCTPIILCACYCYVLLFLRDQCSVSNDPTFCELCLIMKIATVVLVVHLPQLIGMDFK